MSALAGWTCSTCGKDTEPCACPDPQLRALEACVERLCEVSNYIGPFGIHKLMFDKLTETIELARAALPRPEPKRSGVARLTISGHRCADRLDENGDEVPKCFRCSAPEATP